MRGMRVVFCALLAMRTDAALWCGARAGTRRAITPHMSEPSLEQRLRAAKADAAEARNAEARLRQMVAKADRAGAELVEQRRAVEAELFETREELVALRALWEADRAALDEANEELMNGHDGDGGDADAPAEAAAATAELAEARAAAARAVLARTDMAEELEAVRELARGEEARLAERVAELAAELQRSRASAGVGASSAAGGGAAGRIAELEAQVAQLLVELEGGQEAAAELLVLRPKAARLESELREARAEVERLREAR